MAEPTPILALVRDLMFSSKIASAARELGIELRVIRDPAALGTSSGSKLFVDLNQPGAIEAARQWKAQTGGVTIGFVSHVDAATIAQAQEAGFDQVLARGQFTQLLPNLLRD